MNRAKTTHQRRMEKMCREDIHNGTLRTDDDGLVAYLLADGFKIQKIYTKNGRPQWLYFVIDIGSDTTAKLCVHHYHSGRCMVDAQTYREWMTTVYDHVSTFKRKYPEGGVWTKKLHEETEKV